MAINDLPSNVSYGTVTGRFLLAYSDSADSDLYPDGVPAKGTILFTPSAAYIKDPTALVGTTVTPVTILPATVQCSLDADGYLLGSDGTRGVRLVATDDPDLNPVGWTWQVDYRLFDQEDAAVRTIGTHDIELPSGEVVDLTLASPVPSANGTYYIVGPQGEDNYTLALLNGFVGTYAEWAITQTAYGIAVENGFVGTVEQWLDSLTAYGVAVDNGFVGTVTEWLTSITAYGVAVDNGFFGTELEWLDSLTAYGVAVTNGYTGSLNDWLLSLTAYGVAVTNGYTGTQVEWLLSLTAYGVAVTNGFVGTQAEWLTSLTAYGVAVDNGYIGTETEWLATLTAYGVAVDAGYTGTIEEWLVTLIGPEGPQGPPGNLTNLQAEDPVVYNSSTSTLSLSYSQTFLMMGA